MTECFQQFVGVSNGFLYALENRQRLVWSLKNALKSIYLVGCHGMSLSEGTWSSQTLYMAFSSHLKLLATLMDPVGSSMAWSGRTFIRKSGRRFVFMPEIFTRSFVKTTTSESRRLIREKLLKCQMNGTVVQNFLAFLELQKFLGNICSFKTLLFFLKKKSLGAAELLN